MHEMGDIKSTIERQVITEITTRTPLATLFSHTHPMSFTLLNVMVYQSDPAWISEHLTVVLVFFARLGEEYQYILISNSFLTYIVESIVAQAA